MCNISITARTRLATDLIVAEQMLGAGLRSRYRLGPGKRGKAHSPGAASSPGTEPGTAASLAARVARIISSEEITSNLVTNSGPRQRCAREHRPARKDCGAGAPGREASGADSRNREAHHARGPEGAEQDLPPAARERAPAVGDQAAGGGAEPLDSGERRRSAEAQRGG